MPTRGVQATSPDQRTLFFASATPEPAPPRLADIAHAVNRLMQRSGAIPLAYASRPVVLVIDDVHRADESSANLFHFLARSARPLKLMLVATCREDAVHSGAPVQMLLAHLDCERLARGVRVQRLDLASSREQLADYLSADDYNVNRVGRGRVLSPGETLVLLIPALDAGVTLPTLEDLDEAIHIVRRFLASPRALAMAAARPKQQSGSALPLVVLCRRERAGYFLAAVKVPVAIPARSTLPFMVRPALSSFPV